jgi:hypothetical protein
LGGKVWRTLIFNTLSPSPPQIYLQTPQTKPTRPLKFSFFDQDLALYLYVD